MNALNLAHLILSHQSATPMQLQKLAFYCKVWSMVAGLSHLQEVDFYKWKYGPVNPQIYQQYKPFGKEKIPQNSELLFEESGLNQLVEFVLTFYGELSAMELSQMTHQEKPWKITAENQIIKNEHIKKFYSQQNFAKNFTPEGTIVYQPLYLLKDSTWSSFTMDMSIQDQNHFETMSSFAEFQKLRKQAQKEIQAIFCA
jgi:uncharacterized phage-associated protein